ncbi:hypothetical protein [Clostridium felsineum]|uniref:hypothetical protein n=1 Tax=Clostridium felsineum TaxID=36839 RepID=UPI00098CDDF6|nr:hypothetical protein [Clostridium felsineum]URZ15332.1 hypothetical protein CLFE_013500 [Clostridium felsineum DSM 794]
MDYLRKQGDEVNIKSYVRNLLMDSTIINLTADKIVYFLHAQNPTPPYIEYEFVDENGAFYEEGEEIETNYSLQVDVFTKGTSSTEIEEAVKVKLKENGFIRQSLANLHEDTTDLDHTAIWFLGTLGD